MASINLTYKEGWDVLADRALFLDKIKGETVRCNAWVDYRTLHWMLVFEYGY